MIGNMYMRIFKHTGQYYLEKIYSGDLTTDQVADILNIPLDVVDSAYIDYYQGKNPFKKKNHELKITTIQIVISIISTLLVLLTLFEMRAERNATYLPNISLSNTEVAIAWNENGLPYISAESESFFSEMINKNDTQVNILPQIKVYNIGVGTAKDITFTWDTKRNIKQFMDILNTYEDINLSFEENMIYIKTPSMEQGIGESDSYGIDFMLNSTQEYDTLTFPLSYYELIKQIYMKKDIQNVPTLFLCISFSDIQGKTYNKSLQITPKVSFLTQNPDGSGYCIFNLISEEENESVSSLNFDSNSLTAITSICAVVISIISMIFTVIFSLQQLRHNKNSVRPISAIKINDYENQIAVKLENAGTGPLTIRKLRFKNDLQEFPTLISMMPDINQLWNTFTECVDGWTIPVGGQLTLLELCPESEEIKSLVRNKLSEITVFLEYTDVYNTTFYDKRSLEFFGRHSE